MPDFYLLNYILVGDSSVGKSSLLLSLTKKEFKQEHVATVGLEFGSLKIKHQDKRFKLVIWDTAGQERYHSIVRTYFKNALGALLVYDITKRSSFLSLEKWLTDLKEHGNDKVSIILVGNKTDLEANREVSPEEGQEFASKNNLSGFIETSAMYGHNVEGAFFEGFKAIQDKIEAGIIQVEPKEVNNIVSPEIETNQHKEKNGCGC